MQQFPKAEEHFDNAIRLEPQNPVHRVYKGYASLECTWIYWLCDIIVENFASSRPLPVFLKVSEIIRRKNYSELFTGAIFGFRFFSRPALFFSSFHSFALRILIARSFTRD